MLSTMYPSQDTGCCSKCGFRICRCCDEKEKSCNSTSTSSPHIESGNNQGGAGGNSNVSLNICNCDKNNSSDCCCKIATKEFLNYLKEQTLEDNDLVVNSINIYGNLIPKNLTSTIPSASNSSERLLFLDEESLKNMFLSDDVIKSLDNTVSLCSVNVIEFTFEKGGVLSENDNNLKKDFVSSNECKKCCDCSYGINQALNFGMIGTEYVVYIKDSITFDPGYLTFGTVGDSLNKVKLVAVSDNIAIFSSLLSGETVYYAVPLCSISKLEK